MGDQSNSVLSYYAKRESRWGYRWLLGDVRHYGLYTDGFRLGFRRAQRRMEQELVKALGLPPGASVLDSGSGAGVATLRIASLSGWKLVGVDLNPTDVVAATRRARRLTDTVRFQQANYEALPFDANSFDGVYTMETLVHSDDPSRALREFRRVLRPRGRLALLEYTLAPKSRMSSDDVAIWAAIASGAAMPQLPELTHGIFPDLLHSAGFSDVRVHDVTAKVLPMIRQLAWLAVPVYRGLSLVHRERRFVNVLAGATMYAQARRLDNWRYVVVSAQATL